MSALIGRGAEQAALSGFARGKNSGATLGIVWGRRRVGKSFLLETLVQEAGGFYFEAQRGSSAEALRELGERLAVYQHAAAPLLLDNWDRAVDALLALGRERVTLVVLDEFPYLLEHTPGLDSIIQRAFGALQPTRTANRTRLILCGSAVSVMREMLTGTAPLRGRAGLDLRIAPFDFRVARELHGIEDLATAVRTYAVIGGVAAYAREMCDDDMPRGPRDFDRWVCARVLSPAAPLVREVELLLSEDPATAKARKPNLYHATLAGISSGHHAWSALSNYVKIAGNTLSTIIDGLVSADFVTRLSDPTRDNRPSYHPADPLLRFHYAIIRRRQSQLARLGAGASQIWRDALPTFQSQVVGPCFESMSRDWVMHFAAHETLGGAPDHVGSTVLQLPDGGERELDVVVAADDAPTPSGRTIIAIGEAKSGQQLSEQHLRNLETARDALGVRAAGAKLLLFGSDFTAALRTRASRRSDVELVDLARLYQGS